MLKELNASLAAETAESGTQFDELLELAVETMVKDPSCFEARYDEIGTRVVLEKGPSEQVQTLGLWLVSQALNEKVKVDEELVETVKESSRLLLPFDVSIQNKIEALGKSILDDAFTCLGIDAPFHVAKFQSADTDAERLEVCNWLAKRISDIGDLAVETFEEVDDIDDEEDIADESDVQISDGMNFYHPARISPKLIGEYPHIDIEPTCLGYSILVASFFEKTGTDYVHSGVARTAKNEAKDVQSAVIKTTIAGAKKIGSPLPIHLKESFEETLQDNRDYNNHYGFHAAVLARISGRRWVQLDTNYSANLSLDGYDAEVINQEYRILELKSRIARGVEHDFEPDYSTPLNLSYFYIAAELSKKIPSVESVDQFLQDVSPELAFSRIIEEYFGDFIEESDKEIPTLLKLCVKYYSNFTDYSPEELIQDLIHTSLENHIFTESESGDFSECIKKCQRDPEYRRRRAEDLALAPLITIVSLQSWHGNVIVKDKVKMPHVVLESGFAPYRIGASALSDLAVYCGDELPLSFWMTYWPSMVSFAEHQGNAKSTAQTVLREQILADIREERGLKYSSLDGMVSRSASR